MPVFREDRPIDTDFQVVTSRRNSKTVNDDLSKSLNVKFLKIKQHQKSICLETFKTKKCESTEKHDHRLCCGWHGDGHDRRRNPFLATQYYFPDEAQNNVERVYHPMVFRTSMCPHSLNSTTDLDFGCPYGLFCARAHFEELLRDKDAIDYPPRHCDIISRNRSNVCNLRDFILSDKSAPSITITDRSTSALTTNLSVSSGHYQPQPIRGGNSATLSNEVLETQRVYLTTAETFFFENAFVGKVGDLKPAMTMRKLFETEAVRHTCSMGIEMDRRGRKELVVTGMNARECAGFLLDRLSPSSFGEPLGEGYKSDFVILAQQREFRVKSQSVLERLREDIRKERLKLNHNEEAHGQSEQKFRLWRLSDGDKLSKQTKSNRSILYYDLDEVLESHNSKGNLSNEVVTFNVYEAGCGLQKGYNKTGCNAHSGLDAFFYQIQSWIEKEKYDDLRTCLVCCDEFLPKQGISCPNKHFVCSIQGGCFDGLMESQKEKLQAQGGELHCPDCSKPIASQQIARHVSKKTWDVHFASVVEAKVSKEVEKQSKAFDEKLDSKVLEFMENYTNSGEAEQIKIKAKMHAEKAKNEAMDLRCPNPLCRQVYIDFDGCMALECARCGQHFCAFCHKACANGMGCHDHVRECVYNNTRNGSYYASKEEIEDAQMRYRIRKLKAFLHPLKKGEQNATVAELKGELEALKIDPAALMDFGNMQHELLLPYD